MTLLVLNRRRSLDYLSRWLPEGLGDLVVLTDRATINAHGTPALPRGAIRHLEVVDKYEAPETDDLIERLCLDHAVQRILSTGEGDVLRAARIRQRLGLPGQDVRSAESYRNKYVMKTIASASGVQVAPMRLITSSAQLTRFSQEYGFPVVAKAVDGGACVGQHVLRDKASLDTLVRAWDRTILDQPLLAEAWIEGETYHVDGVMDAGDTLLSVPSRYLYSQWLTHHDSAPLLSGMLQDGDQLCARLQDATARVVRALPGPPGACAFHAEFFLTADDRILLCEIACRAGGGSIVKEFEFATGVNLHGVSLRGQAGLTVDLSTTAIAQRYGLATWFPPMDPATLLHVPLSCPLPGAVEYVVAGKSGSYYAGRESPSHRVADLLFRLSPGDLVGQLRAVDQWWANAARWELHAGPAADTRLA
jgi:hypothetical protein